MSDYCWGLFLSVGAVPVRRGVRRLLVQCGGEPGDERGAPRADWWGLHGPPRLPVSRSPAPLALPPPHLHSAPLHAPAHSPRRLLPHMWWATLTIHKYSSASSRLAFRAVFVVITYTMRKPLNDKYSFITSIRLWQFSIHRAHLCRAH